ncbi:MAG: hypothetical protein GY823_09385 [Flavobacteriaceae bacterium]|nr:hypothetical protein [Flavobacteriaceae bacterium]
MFNEKWWERDFSETNGKNNSTIKSIANSNNGKFILSAFDDSIEVLNAHSGKTLNKLKTGHRRGILYISISKFGNYFATAGADNKIILWDGSELSASKKFSLSSKAQDIKFIGFNNNETTLYILTSNEIVIFKIRPEEGEKELKKI